MRIKINFPQRFEHVEDVEIDAEAEFTITVFTTTTIATLSGGRFGNLKLNHRLMMEALGEDEVNRLQQLALKNFDVQAALEEHANGYADHMEGRDE